MILSKHSRLNVPMNRSQIAFALGQVRESTSSEGSSGWPGDFLDLFFDMIDQAFAGVEDGCKHDVIFANFRLMSWPE